jgi:hypothetical protein
MSLKGVRSNGRSCPLRRRDASARTEVRWVVLSRRDPQASSSWLRVADERIASLISRSKTYDLQVGLLQGFLVNYDRMHTFIEMFQKCKSECI